MARNGPWEQAIIASLVALKQSGCRDFEWAWSVAEKRHPARARDNVVATLFDETGQREESVRDALKRYAEDAWYGYRPGLRYFSLDLLRESDGATDAHRAGHIRQAA